jgi:hypothetical protein
MLNTMKTKLKKIGAGLAIASMAMMALLSVTVMPTKASAWRGGCGGCGGGCGYGYGYGYYY